ncbi:MAG: helix-turn-helix domain-containing protein [Clostridiales Family XIII bacterium]|nr:helix-turn-helix domain-containing protein [Clostridiales Family XIII bacterium]
MSAENESDNRREDAAAALLETLAKSEGLRSLVDAGSAMLGNPIIVSDKGWNLMAMTSELEIPDDAGWSEFLKNGTLSLDTISSNIKSKLADRIEQSEAPFCLREQGMKYKRMFGKVLLGGRHAATISALAYFRPFADRDFETMTLLCNAVSAEVQKNKYLYFARGLPYEDLIVNLLEGRVRDESVIEENMRALNLSIKKHIRALAVDIMGFDNEQFSASYIRDFLEKILPGSKAVLYGDKIIAITSHNGAGEFLSADIPRISDFLRKYSIRCGVSRCFEELSALRDHYLQSLEALRLGLRQDDDAFVYFYDDYAIYHIARLCAENADLRTLCHPKLSRLLQYDAARGTAFTRTLRTYLDRARNITDTAAALHMHRNSVIYQLHRIEEMLDIRLSDSNALLHIELSFRFMEYTRRGSLPE